MSYNSLPPPVVDESTPIDSLKPRRVSTAEVLLRVMQEDNRSVARMYENTHRSSDRNDFFTLPLILGVLATGPALFTLYKVAMKFKDTLSLATDEMDADIEEAKAQGFSEEDIVKDADTVKKTFTDLVGSKTEEPKPETVASATPIKSKVSPSKRHLATPTKEIESTLRKASKTHGIDYPTLYSFAGAESSFKADAEASTSSASGILQFTSGTWNYLVNEVYPKLGYSSADRKDPKKAAHVAALYIGRLKGTLKSSLKREPSIGEVYLSYVLGPTGALRFLQALRKDPNQVGSEIFSSAARVNRNLFFKGGEPMTLGETFAKISGKVEGYYNVAKAAEKGSTVASAPITSDESNLARSTVARAEVTPSLPGVAKAVKSAAVKLVLTETQRSRRDEDEEISRADDDDVDGRSSMSSSTTSNPANRQSTYIRDRRNHLIAIPG